MDAEGTMDRRARSKLATMARVQSIALDLFEERGFSNVSIADVAAAADVAERTVYRHFGTKQALVTYDQADEFALARMAELARDHDLVTATRVATAEAFVLLDAEPEAMRNGTRKLRLMAAEPELQAALAHLLTETAMQFAAEVARARELPEDDLATRVAVYAIVAGFGAAAQAWLASDGELDLKQALETALDSLEAF